MTQREAYDKCIELATKHYWQATLCALEEDGFDEVTDFKALYDGWISELE